MTDDLKKQRLAQYLASNSIHYYKNDGSEHVFVYNEIDKYFPDKRKSVIIIPINEQEAIRVPITRLPIDLTEQATKDEILSNRQFMEMLSKRFLRICPEEEAFKARSTKEAMQELSKLAETKVVNLDEMFARNEVDVLDTQEVSQAAEKLEVNLTVMEVLAREDIPEEEKLSTLKNLEDTLTQKDWQYVYDNGTEELKTYALEKLK